MEILDGIDAKSAASRPVSALWTRASVYCWMETQ
jgi:hypothetical protein